MQASKRTISRQFTWHSAFYRNVNRINNILSSIISHYWTGSYARSSRISAVLATRAARIWILGQVRGTTCLFNSSCNAFTVLHESYVAVAPRKCMQFIK
jgi:hypothetical protein